METKQLLEIFEEMTNKVDRYRFGFGGEAEKYISSKNLSRDDLFVLCELLIQDDIFLWLDFVSSKIPLIAKDNKSFVTLLIFVMNKVKNDLAQGPFIRALISLGETYPDTAIDVYRRITKVSRDENITAYAGLILGGIGKVKDREIKEYAKKILTNSDQSPHMEQIRIAIIRALRVMIEKRKALDDKSFYLEMLKKASEIENTENIKLEAIHFNIDLYSFEPKFCFENLIALITTHSTQKIKYHLTHTLRIRGLGDTENEFNLIVALSNDEDEIILNEVCNYLARNHMKNKEKTFDILISLIVREKYFLGDLPYMLNEMGKQEFDFYYVKLCEYLKSETNKKTIRTLGEIIRYLGEKNEGRQEKISLFKKLVNDRIVRLK